MQIKDDTYYPEAFEKCYIRNFHKIRSFVNSYVSDPDQAVSIAQEVFVVLWENREKVNFEEDLLSYLFLIARNKSLNVLGKKESVRKYAAYSMNHSRETLDFYALSHNTSTSVYTKEIQSLIGQALHHMPEKVKETFLLCRDKKLKYTEIAKLQNISVKTVEYRISNALRELRRYLKDYLPFYIGYLLHIMFY